MRLLLACLLLAAAVLPTQAQTVNICDRTPQVRSAILEAIDADECAAVNSDEMASVGVLTLHDEHLTALAGGDFAGLTSLQILRLQRNQLTTLPAGVFDSLTSLQYLFLYDNQLTALPVGVFDDVTSLQELWLDGNQLTTLPDGVFDGLTNLQTLILRRNCLTALPDSVFDSLISLEALSLGSNQLTGFPEGAFDGLASLQKLYLYNNWLTTFPAGVFDGLASLEALSLGGNELTALPDGVFDGLANLQELYLYDNQLTALPDGVFHGLTSLQTLDLSDNKLTLRVGLFDGLTSLQRLLLHDNQLTALPAGVFDGLSSLQTLDLVDNHLVELTRNDALFAGFSAEVDILLNGQTSETRLVAAVPSMVSAADSRRQGFVRIVNESQDSGTVRVFAFGDDATRRDDSIEIRLGANQVVHFNANDLEYGNVDKGIEGVGSMGADSDWRLDIETDLDVRVLAFVRHDDGFLTTMHDVLPRNDQGRLVAYTFNPSSNVNQASSLHLVNTGESEEYVRIVGIDDQGRKKVMSFPLAGREPRTLSAFDLENGWESGWRQIGPNQWRNFVGPYGTLGDGSGKWRLFITAGRSVVGISLLESVTTGHLTNISTAGVAGGGVGVE